MARLPSWTGLMTVDPGAMMRSRSDDWIELVKFCTAGNGDT